MNRERRSTGKKISENKDVDLTPTDMDSFKIKIFGNLCNLKCTMCNPNASSKIAAEFKKHGEWNKPAIINPSKQMDMNKFVMVRHVYKSYLPVHFMTKIVILFAYQATILL